MPLIKQKDNVIFLRGVVPVENVPSRRQAESALEYLGLLFIGSPDKEKASEHISTLEEFVRTR